MVLPGAELTLARDFLFKRVFIRELFPTFERPEKAIYGIASAGNCLGNPALIRNDTFCVFIAILTPYLVIDIVLPSFII